MAAVADAVLLWDWERSARDVPLGFDAVHHELQARLERGEDAESAVGATVARAAERLAPFEVPPSAAEVTALLYLVDLATRYLADRQAQSRARLGVLRTRLLPGLLQRVGELVKHPRRARTPGRRPTARRPP